MSRNQLYLFPEFDPNVTLIKNIDYIDLTEIKQSENIVSKTSHYDVLEPGRFTLFKTGGTHRWRKELGNNMPYILNNETGKIIVLSLVKSYPRACIWTRGKIDKCNINMHRLVAEAFVVNKDPVNNKIVHHINEDKLDYRVTNLAWVTSSQNSLGLKRPRDENYEVKKIRSGIL